MTSAPAAITGSPPRAWGKAGSSRGVHLCLRFTPTCVGKRSSPGQGVVQSPVHPHVRGEKNRATSSGCSPGGSPPRAWGKDRVGLRARGSDRFTPTCVGKSPRTTTVRRVACWFTPTCVGKRESGRRACRSPGVHPHVRGEKFYPSVRHVSYLGSPPRAWGKDSARAADTLEPGFTPTCVEKSGDGTTEEIENLVHPHVRGEKAARALVRDVDHGSPPRAWGKVSIHRQIRSTRRFTPTCVGKRRCCCSNMRSSSVHPHVRGEKEFVAINDSKPLGSPPRAWGKVQ